MGEQRDRCAHCCNGWFEDQRFGQDVECVNGILIDIDEAYEGWQSDVAYPVAPCHPMWKRQCAGDETFLNDCQERLDAWANPTTPTPSIITPEARHD